MSEKIENRSKKHKKKEGKRNERRKKHETKNRIYERREEHRRGKWLMKKLRKTGHISHPIRWHMTVGSCQNAMTNSTKQKKICEISDKNIRNWFLKRILKIQNGHKKFHIFSLTFLLLHLLTWLSLPLKGSLITMCIQETSWITTDHTQPRPHWAPRRTGRRASVWCGCGERSFGGIANSC